MTTASNDSTSIHKSNRTGRLQLQSSRWIKACLFLLLLRFDRKKFSDAFVVTSKGAKVSTANTAFTSTPARRMAPPSAATEANIAAESITGTLVSTQEDQVKAESTTSVRAPLKYIGPYPSLGLRFPNLATSAQRSRNESGVSLDFVLDTAANTNTINAQVAQELKLRSVGDALPGVGSSGFIAPGGQVYELGDAQLEGLGTDDIFMQNLTAASLPVAGPAAAGLLSQAFFYCFDGGVMFNWKEEDIEQKQDDGEILMKRLPPSVTFLGDASDAERLIATHDMTRVPIEPVPITQLPSVQIKLNGVVMPALLDTGSPITCINTKAAKRAGIETASTSTHDDKENTEKKSGLNLNPFAGITDRWKEAQEMAQAAAKGELLQIAGPDGRPVALRKSSNRVQVSLISDTENKDVVFGGDDGLNVYVGDIPGLAALNGIGVDSPPAVVLGMDVLRSRPMMLLKARQNEVFF